MSNSTNTISRKQAQSGKVSYGNPVTLHESSQSRVIMIPFFIPHSDHTELAIKIQTYKKGTPPLDFKSVEDKSITLSESAARELLTGLKSHLAVAGEVSDGEYLVIRLSEGTADNIESVDPQAVASALVGILGQQEITEHLKGVELTTELAGALKSSIRLSEMRDAVVQLRNHLDQGEVSEQVYQKWCEQHSWAFGNTFIMNDQVRELSPGDNVDLLLPTIIGYRDIVELKRPDMEVLQYDAAHKNYYFSSEISKAIGQCHRYLDVFSDVAANGLRDHPEIVAYYPNARIVIGRSNEWDEIKLKALHGLNSRLSGISIMTYDHLLSQGERLIGLLLNNELLELADTDTPEITDIIDDDNNFPF